VGRGGGATHDMWQIGFSINCNDPVPAIHCPGGVHGGKWGWIEFDHWADPTGGPNGNGTDGDAELAVCVHGLTNPDAPPASAFHETVDIHAWKFGMGLVGFKVLPVFILDTYTETFFGGPKYGSTPEVDNFGPNANFASGFPTTPGHYDAADLGFPDTPGLSISIQVAFRAGVPDH
jgi:hypothetical protein